MTNNEKVKMRDGKGLSTIARKEKNSPNDSFRD